MKNIYTLTTILILSLSSFANTYNVYTAKASGSWTNSATWTVVLRNDNVKKDKFIIPYGITITANEDVNSMGYTDVELQISGKLLLSSSVTLYFGNNSKIDILYTGSIDAEGLSQQIFIGNVSKYMGNKNKTIKGPVYADNTTGIAPNGFSVYTVLSLTNNAAAVTGRNNDKSTVVYAANKNINIEFNSDVRSTVSVKLVNMNGLIVSNTSFNHPSSKLSLDMSNLKTGVYVVQVTGNNYTTTVNKIFLN